MSIDNTSDRTSETYTGHGVIGPNGETIGKVTDVVYEKGESAPAWLVVNPGILQAEHYAPVAGSYATDDGDIVLPFDKKWLKGAPKATGDYVVDGQLEQELVDHYGSPLG